MKLGDVLRKEREKRGLSATEVAARLGVSEEEYGAIEAGESPAEQWGPRLAELAIRLETPTSRLIAESGRSSDAAPGQAGRRIRQRREERGLETAALAEALGIGAEEYAEIEAGGSPLETWGPLFLAFAEAIDQPVFNLFYPCGLDFRQIEDYP